MRLLFVLVVILRVRRLMRVCLRVLLIMILRIRGLLMRMIVVVIRMRLMVRLIRLRLLCWNVFDLPVEKVGYEGWLERNWHE